MTAPSAAWDELRIVLQELREVEPRPLQGFPDPRVDRNRHPPFHIRLQPWAVDVAERLHRQFGDAVLLTVGALAYPEEREPLRPTSEDREQAVDAPGIEVTLPEPVVVVSGHTVRSRLRVTNHEDDEVVLLTNGTLVARVLDPETRAVVGRFAGAMTLPLVKFAVGSGNDTDVPLLVGTASLVQTLGYSVPPGQWMMDTILKIAGGRQVRTAPLPLTVTP